MRFHVLKLADLMLDFRNKRNVGHPGEIDVNEMDSTMMIQSANWIVAELIRIEMKLSPADAQNEIKKIIERKVPIIEEIGGRLKCLNRASMLKKKPLFFVTRDIRKQSLATICSTGRNILTKASSSSQVG